jgi:transposase
MNNITQSRNFVGIDISKKYLDVYIHPTGKLFKVANDEIGHRNLITIFANYNPEIVVFEASGGYEVQLLLALQQQCINVWRLEPRRVKAFKKSDGIYAKTDASDAKVLAMFAAEKKQKYKQRSITEKELQFQALVRRRDDIKKHLVAEKTRLHQAYDDICKKQINHFIQFCDEQSAEIDKQIKLLIKENQDWSNKSRIAQSMPGVGPVLFAKLITELPELGNATDKEIAALAGVAPYANQSGNFKGRSFIQGGRFELRKDLYMAALSAAFHNSVFKKFYEKLCNSGKKPKVAILAVARKMLVILNAMFRKQQLWKEA